MENWLDPQTIAEGGRVPLPRPDPRNIIPSESARPDNRPWHLRAIPHVANTEDYAKGAIHPNKLLEVLGYPNVNQWTGGDAMQIYPWDVMHKPYRYQTQGL